MPGDGSGGTVSRGVALTKDVVALVFAFVGAVGAGVKVQMDTIQVARDQADDRRYIAALQKAVTVQGKELATTEANIESLQRQIEVLHQSVEVCSRRLR